MSVRSLDATEKRTLALLGLPTAALALAITIVTAYVPVVASEFLDSSVVIGALIAPALVGAETSGLALAYMVLALVAACVVSRFDSTIRSAHRLHDIAKVPNLAVIPRVPLGQRRRG